MSLAFPLKLDDRPGANVRVGWVADLTCSRPEFPRLATETGIAAHRLALLMISISDPLLREAVAYYRFGLLRGLV